MNVFVVVGYMEASDLSAGGATCLGVFRTRALAEQFVEEGWAGECDQVEVEESEVQG